METQKFCPNCRKPLPPDVPLGLCPECLIKSGFPTEGGGGAPGEVAGARFVPPPTEEIARLFPQLEILGLIGKGGMGAVYKARQPALDRFVALKVLPPAVGSDPGFAERFNREARALARLNHPNIVAVHDFGKAGPLHYLIMEFVDGTNLREVEHAGRLSPEQALAIVPQICEALNFAHNEGIVHRDIKPENLLIDKKGRVKITDFGIAKIVGLPVGKVSLTGAKDVVGTPHYMAPEQIEKPSTVDHRADIYSLGVVFYEMLTGELPLGKFQPPSQKVQVDVRLDEVVLHALEKEPSRRYQQASQVKTDVETIAGTVPPAAGFAAKGGVNPLPATPAGKATSDKAILPALLLAFPFGLFGAHRFYVGKIWTAFLQLGALGGCILLIIACATNAPQPITGVLLGFLVCGCFIWALIDWILIACKAFTDGQGRRMTHWLHPQAGDSTTPAGPTTGASPLTGSPSTPPPGGTVPPTLTGLPSSPLPPKGAPGLIVAPAVGLMVAAVWKLFSSLTAWLFLAAPTAWLGSLLGGFGLGAISGVAGISLVLFKVIPALLVLYGAVQMLQLRSYAWGIAAGILAIVMCSLIGLPVGIWALIVLARQDVRDLFANAARSPAPGIGNWPWIVAGTIIVGMMVVSLMIAFLIPKRATPANPIFSGGIPGIGNTINLGNLPIIGRKPAVTVHGNVTDAVTGKPIAGARITAAYDRWGTGSPAEAQSRECRTDKKGHFKLNTWRGIRTLNAYAPGYEPKTNRFEDDQMDDDNVGLDFELQPANVDIPVLPTPPTTAPTLPTPPAPLSPPVPLVPPAPVIPPATTGTQGQPYVHREKIIGQLTSTDEFQKDFNRTIPFNAGGRISLDNVNGHIEIAGWNRDEVVIKALKHGKTRESVEAAKIDVVSSPDEITIHTEKPSSTTGSPSSWFNDSKKNDATVDYAIQVPRRTRLNKIESVNGTIVIENVAGDIKASTVNGTTHVEDAAGDLKLSTVNGRIEASLLLLGNGQSLSFDSVNGQIEATLPADANATVSASTINGNISSDFSALRVKKNFPLGSDLNGTLGNGGGRVKASTVNGGISFRRGAEVN